VAPAKRLTIRDIAAAAGVSTQTVSRVLNNRPDVSAETAERVRRVIQETGYAPNMLARSLTQGRSHVLGVVAYGLHYFGPSQVLMAIERQAAEMGYAIMLNLILQPGTAAVEHLLDGFTARRVDGVIWAIPEVGDNRSVLQSRVADLPLPVIIVGGSTGRPCLASIAIDNAAIGRLAAEHLIGGGARHVGIITGPMSWWEARQRLEGWRQTMVAHGRTIEDCLVVEGDWTVSSGERAFNQIIDVCPDIDAIYASNDQMALGVLHAALCRGMRVPEDLAVIGTDNTAEGSHYWPPLSTVDQPLGLAGEMAVKAIDGLIASSRTIRRAADVAPEMTLLEPELIVRQSTRPVMASATPDVAPASGHGEPMSSRVPTS